MPCCAYFRSIFTRPHTPTESYDFIPPAVSLYPQEAPKETKIKWNKETAVISIPSKDSYHEDGTAKDLWGPCRPQGTREEIRNNKLSTQATVEVALRIGILVQGATFPDSMEMPWPRHRDYRPYAHHLKDIIYTC